MTAGKRIAVPDVGILAGIAGSLMSPPPRHGGRAGTDTRWLTISPEAPPPWIRYDNGGRRKRRPYP